MSKHWYDDYEANGYVYWYGKYYPKEGIDALFKNSLDDDKRRKV